MKSNKLTKWLLTGALALGGLGIGSMADLPIGMEAEKAEAAVLSDIWWMGADYSNNSLNALTVDLETYGWEAGYADFQYKHNARFTIKNSVGTIVKTGSFNMWTQVAPTEEVPWRFLSKTNISLSGLPKNASQYRIDVSVPLDDVNMNQNHRTSFSRGFQYNADGTLTNFRD